MRVKVPSYRQGEASRLCMGIVNSGVGGETIGGVEGGVIHMSIIDRDGSDGGGM